MYETPSLLRVVHRMFEHSKEREWFETYWAFDIHGSISRPDYRRGFKKDPSEPPLLTYYPYAKETLQLLTTRTDIIMFSFTSSYPEELQYYIEEFKKDNIIFNYHNENPEVSDAKGSFGYYEKKPYFNVYFEDKAGFIPEEDWEPILRYLQTTEYRPNPKWSLKYKEEHHQD